MKVILEMDTGQTQELASDSIKVEISTLCLREGEEWELVARGISPSIVWKQETDSASRDKKSERAKEWVEF